MAITKKLQDAINNQLNRELYSAYLYLSMAAYFESLNLKGFSNWMKVQVQEEAVHTMKFFDYLAQRGGRPTMLNVEAPPNKWKSPLAAFEYTYKHEQMVTGLISKLVDISRSEKDHATENYLQWFIAEQVEEEDSASTIVEKIKLMADAPGGMFLLDQELSQRVFASPASNKENE